MQMSSYLGGAGGEPGYHAYDTGLAQLEIVYFVLYLPSSVRSP